MAKLRINLRDGYKGVNHNHRTITFPNPARPKVHGITIAVIAKARVETLVWNGKYAHKAYIALDSNPVIGDQFGTDINA